jgi:hypothetical protein
MKTALGCVVLAALVFAAHPAQAQARDSLLNGALIGAAIGAGAGVAFTHAVRDSDLTFSQYTYGALIFAAIGAGAGLGVDALFQRTGPGAARRQVTIAPAFWRDVRGIAVQWRW